MADIHGSPGAAPQMPAAPNAGPAPAPYQGADQSPEPPDYAVSLGVLDDPGVNVMSGVTGLNTTESPVAHDVNAGAPDAPYYPGPLSPIFTGGDDDAGGRSPVAGDPAAAVANSTGRWRELQSDLGSTGTPGPGAQPVHAGVIGDLMNFPPSPLDPGAGVGNTSPIGGFYDPDRDYGGEQGAPGYQGEAI